jgi:hypothetical protein
MSAAAICYAPYHIRIIFRARRSKKSSAIEGQIFQQFTRNESLLCSHNIDTTSTCGVSIELCVNINIILWQKCDISLMDNHGVVSLGVIE